MTTIPTQTLDANEEALETTTVTRRTSDGNRQYYLISSTTTNTDYRVTRTPFGVGSFSTVHKCRRDYGIHSDVKDPEKFAVKKLVKGEHQVDEAYLPPKLTDAQKDHMSPMQMQEYERERERQIAKIIEPALREIYAWKVFGQDVVHSSFLRLIDICQTPRHFWIVTELAEGGDLQRSMKHRIEKRCLFEDKEIIPMDGELRGHFQYYDNVVVADFGLSNMLFDNSFMSTDCGTSEFKAPEQSDGGYDDKVDMWALGLICYHLFTGQLLRDPQTPLYLGGIPPNAQNFIYNLVRINPAERMTSQTARQHPWLNAADSFHAVSQAREG
ncbi:hypothetical protein BGZ83_001059 [Gryganskiella cystojenkinii]|nr:hypothetical protein BGZ83_001059 [Gryganskiella cystojenkinii]